MILILTLTLTPDPDDSVSEEWDDADVTFGDGDSTPVVEVSATATAAAAVAPLPVLPRGVECLPAPTTENTDPEKVLKRPTPSMADEGESLMSEVMKEVQKITNLTDTSVKVKRPKMEMHLDESRANVEQKSLGQTEASVSFRKQQKSGEGNFNMSDEHLGGTTTSEPLSGEGGGGGGGGGGGFKDSIKIINSSTSSSTDHTPLSSSLNTSTLSTASTYRDESLTSGYLSDSDVTLSDGKCDSGYPRSSAFNNTLTSQQHQQQQQHTASSVTTSCFTTSSVGGGGGGGGGGSSVTTSSVISQEFSKSAFIAVKSEAPSGLPLIGGKESLLLATTDMPTPSAFTSVVPHKTEDVVTGSKEDKPSDTKTASDTNTLPKKESIYSRIMKRKDKEPIYAKIKPKLNIETSFQPIEPSVGKNTWTGGGVVKPEPVYSTVKPRDPGGSVLPSGPMSAPTSQSPRPLPRWVETHRGYARR
ncbi:hypothetical protein Pmani_030790 [Petrolisthes manimaculis]|uniref:Uncharacterized protein n=1 Tax=Petrolisthes manimaculis TaxID=1843537 RepID=A0AAE1NWL5_9EUCA|nr:hypothetical protein Pmani_030790 [Petrolisthes manimaculis]